MQFWKKNFMGGGHRGGDSISFYFQRIIYYADLIGGQHYHNLNKKKILLCFNFFLDFHWPTTIVCLLIWFVFTNCPPQMKRQII